LRGNVALHNGLGFLATLLGPTLNNTAAANSQAGFIVIPGTAAVFEGNSAIGNGGPGVIVNFSSDAFDMEPNGGNSHFFSSFRHNSVFGNDRNRPQLALFPATVGPAGASIPARALTVVC
jgi:hypothetical protein